MAIKIKREERENNFPLITVTDTRPYLNWTYEGSLESDDMVKDVLKLQNTPSYNETINSVLLYAPSSMVLSGLV